MALSINDLKNGITIDLDNAAWMVIDSEFVKPGKGAAFTRCKLRNIRTGNILDRTFRGDEKIEEAYIEELKLQYLYNNGDIYFFMDNENYEEKVIDKDVIKDKIPFLKDNLDVIALAYNDVILTVNLPNFIVYEIVHTEPGIKGDTAKSGTKPAKISTGAVVNVPLFIDQGDKIKVDTRTGEYVERSNA